MRGHSAISSPSNSGVHAIIRLFSPAIGSPAGELVLDPLEFDQHTAQRQPARADALGFPAVNGGLIDLEAAGEGLLRFSERKTCGKKTSTQLFHRAIMRHP